MNKFLYPWMRFQPAMLFEEPGNPPSPPEPPAPKKPDEPPAPKKPEPPPEPKKPTDEEARLLKEVMKTKADAETAAAELKKIQAQLAAYEGLDPEKVKALVKAEHDAEKAKAEAAGEYERAKEMMREEHAKEKGKLESDLQASLDARKADQLLINQLTIGNDFAASDFIRENLVISPTKVRKLYGEHFEVRDGRTVAFDKPAGAENRTMLINSSGAPLTFDEALKKIVDGDPDKESILAASVTPGAGSKTSPGKKQVEPPKDNLYGRSRIAASFKNDK